MFVSQPPPSILHADLDSFYASVEQRDNPRLRGRAVIVGAGVVLAASYEAKSCGVRAAMGGRQALRMCPRAVVVAPRMSAYTEASRAVFDIFEKDGTTQLRFTHEGLVPAYECFDVCSNAWGSYVNGSLRSLIETGRGRPNKRKTAESRKASR